MFKRVATPNDTRFQSIVSGICSRRARPTRARLSGGGTKSAPATGGANLPLAWDVTTGHSSVVLAVIDTGIVNHQDLNGAGIAPFSETYVPNGRFLAGYDFISENVGAGTHCRRTSLRMTATGAIADPSDPGDWVTTQKKRLSRSFAMTDKQDQQNSSWHGSSYGGRRGRDDE